MPRPACHTRAQLITVRRGQRKCLMASALLPCSHHPATALQQRQPASRVPTSSLHPWRTSKKASAHAAGKAASASRSAASKPNVATSRAYSKKRAGTRHILHGDRQASPTLHHHGRAHTRRRGKHCANIAGRRAGCQRRQSGPVRSGQVRSGQVRSGQVRSGQVRSGEVRSLVVSDTWARKREP